MQKKRNKRTSRPTEGLVVRHEGSGGASRWGLILMLPVTMAAAALAFRFYQDNADLEARLQDIPTLEASRDQINDALTTERLRGDALEKELVALKQGKRDTELALEQAREKIASQPTPVFDSTIKPAGIDLSAISIKPGEGSRNFRIALQVSRTLVARGLPAPGRKALGHATLEQASATAGNVRVVVVPKDEGNGKRVYLPQKSWRRSEGFQYKLNGGEQADFNGNITLPDGFKPGSVRIEVFVNQPSGGYILLRKVMPWPKG